MRIKLKTRRIMSPSEAAGLLRKYNEYRRGEASYPDVSAEEVGWAIDLAISFLQAAVPSDVRRFRFGNVRYEVFPCEDKYKVVRRGFEVAYTDNKFIYDYCDTELARQQPVGSEHMQNYFKAKHMAVALFKKQKK